MNWTLDGKTADQIQQLPWQSKLDVVMFLHNPTAEDIKVIIGPDDGYSPEAGLSLRGVVIVLASASEF